MSVDVYGINNESILKHYYEPDVGLFIAESPNVIERALDAGYVPESFLIEEGILSEQELLLTQRYEDVPIYLVDDERKKEITGYPMTRGMLAAMKRQKLLSVYDIIRNSKRIVVLENIMNPTNIGAIFRSAAALGMDAILLTTGSCDPLYRRAARVSMGTVFQIPWTYMKKDSASHWIDTTGKTLREYGFKIVSMALKKDTIDICDPILKTEDRIAIVLGTEGEGLDNYTIDNSDMTVKIPMFHGVDSLNVAAASAVAFWELSKDRGIKMKAGINERGKE